MTKKETDNIIVGQILYFAEGDIIRSAEVKKIAKKYIYVQVVGGWSEYQIDKNTLNYVSKNGHQYNKQFYRTEQEILDIQTKKELRQKICQHLGYSYFKKVDYTLEQLRKVIEILGIE